jgi:O-antigen/teichoic acid export membrane protein
MPISIISVAKNSMKLTSVKVIAAVAGLGVTLYAGTILTPEEYGTYGLLSLWLLYSSLVAPGIFRAASREIPVLLGRVQDEEALKVQNAAISAEILYTIIPAVIIIGTSFLYTNPTMKIGLPVIALSYIVVRLTAIWSNMNIARQRFNKVALGSLVITLVSPAVALLTLHWLKVYALIIGPLVAQVAGTVYYLTKGNIGFRFHLDRQEIIRLVKIGVVLQGLMIMLWAFRMADRTIIAAALPLAQLGLYTFAIGFLMQALNLFQDFGMVLQPTIWKEASTAENVFQGFKDTRRIAVYLALGTAIFIPLSQLIFCLIVTLITKKFTDSIPIFSVLSYNLFLMAIAIVPSIIMNSSLVNRQKIMLSCYAVGLALNIVFDIMAVRLGYGVIGIAWVTIGTQGLVTLSFYYFIKGYIFKTNREFSRFAGTIVLPFLACFPFYFLHTRLYTATGNLWTFTGISLAAQVAVWALIIGIFYRGYLSAQKFRVVIREIRSMIARNRTQDSDIME